MPLLIKKLKQWTVIFAALAISGTCYLLFPLAQSVPPLLAAVVRARPGPGQRAAGDHVAALRRLAARAPGRGGGPAHLAAQRQPHHRSRSLPAPRRPRSGMAPVFWVLAACLLGGAWFARKQWQASKIRRHETRHAYAVPGRAPARQEPDQRRPAAADRDHRARLQGDQHARQQGRARRRPGLRRQRERAGRGAEEARRAVERDPARGQRMGRQPRRARLRGDGGPAADPDALPARRVPAAVRPARRLVQHRRQHLGRHHLLGAALPEDRRRQVLRAERAGLPAAGRKQVAAGFAVYGPTTVFVLTVGDGVHGFTLDRETYTFVQTHPEHPHPRRTRRSSPSTPRTCGAGSRR